eukprot:1195971-Prorocentrum_minimum.AAC.3
MQLSLAPEADRASSPLRLVPTPGICSLFPCDWFQPLEYALYSPAIGSNPWNMLSSLLRLVSTPGIFCPSGGGCQYPLRRSRIQLPPQMFTEAKCRMVVRKLASGSPFEPFGNSLSSPATARIVVDNALVAPVGVPAGVADNIGAKWCFHRVYLGLLGLFTWVVYLGLLGFTWVVYLGLLGLFTWVYLGCLLGFTWVVYLGLLGLFTWVCLGCLLGFAWVVYLGLLGLFTWVYLAAGVTGSGAAGVADQPRPREHQARADALLQPQAPRAALRRTAQAWPHGAENGPRHAEPRPLGAYEHARRSNNHGRTHRELLVNSIMSTSSAAWGKKRNATRRAASSRCGVIACAS